MTRRSAARASDLDRELVADHLRQATADGRIGPDELEQRLEVALSAQTYRQLGVAMSDLPASGGPDTGMPLWAAASLGLAGSVGVLAAAAVATAIFAGVASASLVAIRSFGRTVPA